MNHRERQMATIRHELTDRISVDAIAIENAQEIATYLGLENTDQVYDHLGIDGRIVLAERYEEQRKTNADGQQLTEWGTLDTGDYGTARAAPLAQAQSIADIERYVWPDPLAFDFNRAASTARELGQKYALRGPYWKPLFCQVCDLFGMEEAMLRMLLEPSIFEAALEHVYDHVYRYCQRLLDVLGDDLPILCLGDDFATQRGMMIDPEKWRKVLKPWYAKLFGLGKQRGKLVWFHSCGNIVSVLPDLIDIGMDVWETVQLHTLSMSPELLKANFGRDITFFGAINTQHLPFATPEEIRAETLQCIKVLGKNGGYICGPDHHVKPNVPVENVLALFDTAICSIVPQRS